MQAMDDRAILGIVLFENQKFDSMFSDGPQDSDTENQRMQSPEALKGASPPACECTSPSQRPSKSCLTCLLSSVGR
jgi:hypothetical protein